MDHADHVALIHKGISTEDKVWADFGSGEGAFTLALLDLLGPQSTIYSVDLSAKRLEIQKEQVQKKFPHSNIVYINQDFTKKIAIPPIDGILLANSIHYVEHKQPFLLHLKSYLKNQGKVIIVEYNVDEGNFWVPFPVSFSTLSNMLLEAGYSKPELLGTIPSGFLEEIYSVRSYVFM